MAVKNNKNSNNKSVTKKVVTKNKTKIKPVTTKNKVVKKPKKNTAVEKNTKIDPRTLIASKLDFVDPNKELSKKKWFKPLKDKTVKKLLNKYEKKKKKQEAPATKLMKMHDFIYKHRFKFAAITCTLILIVYISVNWFSFFGENLQVAVDHPDFDRFDKFNQNKLSAYFGKLHHFTYFTVISFTLFTLLMIIRNFYNSPLMKLLILFSCSYCLLVFVLFNTMLLPFLPFNRTPGVIAVEAFVHAIIPLISFLIFKEMRVTINLRRDLVTFMILPIAYYIMNWVIFLISKEQVFTYFFFKFSDPFFLDLSPALLSLINIVVFISLILSFIGIYFLLYRYLLRWEIKEEQKRNLLQVFADKLNIVKIIQESKTSAKQKAIK